jgi:hypothetical protein
MYQTSATRTSWRRKEIPPWFREGMASVTADQGYRWPSLEDLARHVEAHPEQDLLVRPEDLMRTQNARIYGAAHHAFAFLARRYGDEKIRELMAGMSAGAVFPDAFEAALGISAADFIADFQRYVRLRGFR